MSLALNEILTREASSVAAIKRAVAEAVAHTLRGIKDIPVLSFRSWAQDADKNIDAAFAIITTEIVGREFLTDYDRRVLPSKKKKRDELDFLLLAFIVGLLYVLKGYSRIQDVPYSEVAEFAGGFRAWPEAYKDLLRHHRSMFALDIDKILSASKSKIRDAIRDQITRHPNYPILTNNDWRDQIHGFEEFILDEVDGWLRHLNAAVQFRSQEVLNLSVVSAALMEYSASGVTVYFDVQPNACSECVKAYLTGGRGSAPKEFSLVTLLANGTNMGRRRDEWAPVAGAMHPNCRCTIRIRHFSGASQGEGN